MLLKVVLEPAAASSQSQMANALQDVVQRVRGPYEALLLGAERESRGRAALFTGMCPHCGHGECARCGGAACRHSELVRPSLEALGFDIGRTASELLGVDLLWATNEKAPAYVCLVGALFYP